MDAGLQVHKNNWLLLGEIVQQGTNSVSVNKSRAWYGTLGYKLFTDWMPFFGYAQQVTLNKSDRMYNGPFGIAINPTVSQISTDQSTWTLGLRWDIIDGTDVKLQVDRTTALHGTAGLFNTNPLEPVYFVRGTVDLVF